MRRAARTVSRLQGRNTLHIVFYQWGEEHLSQSGPVALRTRAVEHVVLVAASARGEANDRCCDTVGLV